MRFQGLHQFGSGGEGTRDRDGPAEDRAGVRLSLAAPEEICENGRDGGEHEDVADVEQRIPEECRFRRHTDRLSVTTIATMAASRRPFRLKTTTGAVADRFPP